MGLDIHGAAMLALARRQEMPMRTVLTLGRQESVLTRSWLRHLEREYGMDGEGLDHESEPYAEAFFRRLGAERVESLDFSDYEGCSVCRDLNEPPAEGGAGEGYDLVYDGGTLEHVFHFPNAIATCMSLVRVGGHFMASLPADGWLGHGFYQFSPELFFRVFCGENGFRMVRLFLAENPEGKGRLVRVIDPAESGARCLMESRKAVVMLVWAQKVAEVRPFQAWPKQSDYVSRWEGMGGGGEGGGEAAGATGGMLGGLRRAAGRLVPGGLRNRMAWRRHLKAARRGMIELDVLR
jgi:hypothetical protein